MYIIFTILDLSVRLVESSLIMKSWGVERNVNHATLHFIKVGGTWFRYMILPNLTMWMSPQILSLTVFAETDIDLHLNWPPKIASCARRSASSSLSNFPAIILLRQ